jgi:hypothetical protein
MPDCGHNLPREKTGAYLSAAHDIFDDGQK